MDDQDELIDDNPDRDAGSESTVGASDIGELVSGIPSTDGSGNDDDETPRGDKVCPECGEQSATRKVVGGYSPKHGGTYKGGSANIRSRLVCANCGHKEK